MLAKRILCRNLFANILFDYGHKKKEAQMLEFPFCDPGEARTLDPMIKSHLLYQLSYGVRLFSISVAKVRIIFELASVFANFFREKCDFFGFSSKIALFCTKRGLFPLPNGIKNRPIGFVISREGGVVLP